ncbi:DUF3050 domain-containing protein [Streptomyces sp. NPDC046881]|uniref:DUF3050 domain-containing protein n=1 Tax=Streptomyces sp. NPDC046881 TaxID=3155374 RepID=UPI0033F5C992
MTTSTSTAGNAAATAAVGYRVWVKKITDLPFHELDSDELTRMCYLSWVAAVEFAEALRVAERIHGDHKGLQDMIAGELQTSNLAFDDYRRSGDHHEFLAHFLGKDGQLEKLEAELGEFAAEYLRECRALDDETRAMSVFSREEELPGIFTRFLEAPAENWQTPALAAYRYYLEQHIFLDSDEGGHAELIGDLTVDERVEPFYHARFRLYRCVPAFVQSGAYDTEA